MKKIKRRLAAIMFTDMVGYSALMQKDEEIAGRLRDRHREVFVRNTAAYGGEILQYYGDGTLSIYPSASAAVECAVDIQRELKQAPTVSLRIGIHTGDISYGDEDIFGDGVNIASRIETLCVPGGIFFSSKVHDDIKNLPAIQTRSIGPFKLKNIANEIEIFAVTNEGVNAPPPGYHHKISPFSRMPLADTVATVRTAASSTSFTTQAPASPQPLVGRKRKFVAGILAFFFGIFGAHRFYLGQRNLGLLYLGMALTGMFIIKGLAALIPIVAILSFIDAVILFSMPRRDFDLKYNRAYVQATLAMDTQKFEKPKQKEQPQTPPKKSVKEEEFDKLWNTALAEYREYDYDEAIAALQEAIELKSDDPEAHFLLACCHSINEDIGHALSHLETAVACGLKDQDRIQNHYDLAYLRMQPQFETFAKNNYRLLKELPEPIEDLLQSQNTVSPDLLEQLQKLVKLREEGQLTEIEYQSLVKKLNS